MYKLMVNQYFVKVEAGMKKKDVVGGLVYSNNNSDEVVGRICDYIPKTGFIKIDLMEPLDYMALIKYGIPLSNIIFNNKA